MSGLSALRRSGRFMMMVSKPESSFWRTISFALMVLVLSLLLLVVVNSIVIARTVGWAKARLRRAHQLRRWDGGHAALCPPYEDASYFFTSGHREASSGWNASLPGIVASSL